MTTWTIIKRLLTSESTPGTAGYQVALNRAAGVFCGITRNLRDQKASEAEFNADDEVREALMNSGHLRSVGLLK